MADKYLGWFKLWVETFLADADILDNAELGAFMRLYAQCWRRALPDDPHILRRITRTEDDGTCERLLREFFEVKDGWVTHPGLEAQRREALKETGQKFRQTASARKALADKRAAEVETDSETVAVTETEDKKTRGQEDERTRRQEDKKTRGREA